MKKILFILVMIPIFVFSQKEESIESKLYRYWAQQERKKIDTDTTNKLFYLKNELSLYMNGEKFGEYQKSTYHSMVRSCSDIIKVEKEDSIRTIYYDTLNILQDKMEQLNYLDKINYKTRISWYSKGSKPNRKKIDSIFLDQMVTKTSMDSETLLFYYTNLCFLYLETKNEEDKVRVFEEHMNFVDSIGFGDEYLQKFTKIFSVIFEGHELASMEKNYWENYNGSNNKLIFMINYLETKEMITTGFYKNILDTLILQDPSPNNYFKLATFYKKCDLNSKYEQTLEFIKVKFPQFKDELNYNECVLLYNQESFMNSYDLSMKIGGKYKGQALKIAAMSVASLANKVGSSTFERKCNYYYAIQLLEKSKSYNIPVNSLITQYKKMLPTETEKFTEGNPKKITLETWNVTINIY